MDFRRLGREKRRKCEVMRRRREEVSSEMLRQFLIFRRRSGEGREETEEREKGD